MPNNDIEVIPSSPLHTVQLRDGNGYTRNSVVPPGDTIINAGETPGAGVDAHLADSETGTAPGG
eukprot:8220886-Alexandrium_andersonii.AAC.1